MITKEVFGHCPDGQVDAYTLCNSRGNTATVLTLGGILQKLVIGGTDVTLGYDTLQEYLENSGHFGALIGRVANRIANASLPLGDTVYPLSQNRGKHQIHGGFQGFGKKIWQAEIAEDALVLRLHSAHLDEGFPGELDVTVTYTLTEDDALCIDYRATADRDTAVNMTNHAYFNLNGGGSVLEHTLQLSAEHYTPTDAEGIPSGEILPVAGTPLDFTAAKPLGAEIAATEFGCYDHNFCLSGSGLRRVGVLKGAKLSMEVETTTEGMQIYCADFKAYRKGKGDAVYHGPCFVCLEAQGYPDAVHHAGFPSVLLPKGQEYRQTTVYRFL